MKGEFLMKRTVFLGTVAVMALALAGCNGKGESTDLTSGGTPAVGTPTIGLTYIPNIQFSPFYVALDKGIYNAKGVKASLRHHGSNEGLFTALVSGQEQYVIAGGDELMQARAEGLDLVAIASYYRTYPVVVIVPADSSIKTIADLKGHSIGLPGRYGESWFGLQVALKGAGLTESDVKITEIGYTQQAALTTKKVDAIIGFANNDAVQFGLAGVVVRQIPLARTVPLVSISLVTTGAELKAHPALAKAVADGMVEGIAAVKADPEGAITTSVAQVPGLADENAKKAAAATLAATLKILVSADGTVSGKLDPAQFAAMATFMKAQGLLKTVVDPNAAMSTAYVSK